MGKIRLGTDEIKFMTLFENLTGARVKDCVQVQDAMGFLVNPGDMGLAIGKNGANIEKVRNVVGKNVFVMEYAEKEGDFIKNLFHPVKLRHVRIKDSGDERVIEIDINKKDRRRAIGQEGVKIKIAKEMSRRYLDASNINIKVI